MPKAYNNVAYIDRILAIKNYLFFVSLLFMITACSAGHNSSGNNSDQPGSYNFNNLITHIAFYTTPQVGICPDIPINRDPNIQPPVSQCDLGNNSPSNSQYGCSIEKNNLNDLSLQLAQSIVAIDLPDLDIAYGALNVKCTGIIIESHWILTEAECVTESGGEVFKPDIVDAMVIPWQPYYNGVPTNITLRGIAARFPIKAVYIPKITSQPTSNAYTGKTFALLELESSLPSSYKPIPIESQQSFLFSGDPIWMAGYGKNESQIFDGKLRYRKAYYYSNLYSQAPIYGSGGATLPGPVLIGDTTYGMMYTLGSIPEMLGEVGRSAWSFAGEYDMGGPVMDYNPATHKFSLLAVYNSGLYPCNYTGFNAPLPYSFDQSTQLTESNYILTQEIINGTASRAEVKCVSKSNKCFQKMVYVLSQNGIIMEYRQSFSGTYAYVANIVSGGNPSSFTFADNHKFMLVANYGNGIRSGSISVFKVDSNSGTLTPNIPAEQIIPGINDPTGIVAYDENTSYLNPRSYVYIANQDSINKSSISKLQFNNSSGYLSPQSGIAINSNIDRMKLEDGVLATFDYLGGTVSIVNKSSLEQMGFIKDANNLIHPTDMIYILDGQLITSFGNNSILNYNSHGQQFYDSQGLHPIRIVQRHTASGDIVYVLNFNNIAIFKINRNGTVSFVNSVTSSPDVRYSSMTISGSQLFVIDGLGDNLLIYDILPDGSINFKQQVATAASPIELLAD